MALYVRSLTTDEQRRLEQLERSDGENEVGKRASIVLLSAKKFAFTISTASVDLHPINVRKWIHRFNRQGLNGLYPRRSPGRPRLFSDRQRRSIIEMATTEPENLGLGFPEWSLQRLRGELIARGVMSEISAETIRQELLRGGLVFEGRRWVPVSMVGESAPPQPTHFTVLAPQLHNSR